MRKSLVKYRRNLPARKSNLTWLLGFALVGLVIWLFIKRQGPIGQYTNTESWDVSYNEDGLPTKITIHRQAVRQ